MRLKGVQIGDEIGAVWLCEGGGFAAGGKDEGARNRGRGFGADGVVVGLRDGGAERVRPGASECMCPADDLLPRLIRPR